MRIHAIGRKFANTAKLVRRIVYSDHARCIFEVVFGCIEEPAVRRKEPVAKKMPAGRTVIVSGCLRFVWSKITAKVPGLPRENDCVPGDGVEGDVMSAVG